MKKIPADFPVRPLTRAQAAKNPNACTCGACGRSWDDSIATSYTPAPGGRCPFEYYHAEPRKPRTSRPLVLVNRDGRLSRYGLACGYVDTYPGGVLVCMPSPSAGVVLVKDGNGQNRVPAVLYSGKSLTAARAVAFKASRPFATPRDSFWLCLERDTLEQSSPHASLKLARDEFERYARPLERIGQMLTASVHLAPTRKEIAEYPDFVLSVGPRGGIKVERA
jgi:hypothetical protein